VVKVRGSPAQKGFAWEVEGTSPIERAHLEVRSQTPSDHSPLASPRSPCLLPSSPRLLTGVEEFRASDVPSSEIGRGRAFSTAPDLEQASRRRASDSRRNSDSRAAGAIAQARPSGESGTGSVLPFRRERGGDPACARAASSARPSGASPRDPPASREGRASRRRRRRRRRAALRGPSPRARPRGR
jgi:hypothetical protein